MQNKVQTKKKKATKPIRWDFGVATRSSHHRCAESWVHLIGHGLAEGLQNFPLVVIEVAVDLVDRATLHHPQLALSFRDEPGVVTHDDHGCVREHGGNKERRLNEMTRFGARPSGLKREQDQQAFSSQKSKWLPKTTGEPDKRSTVDCAHTIPIEKLTVRSPRLNSESTFRGTGAVRDRHQKGQNPTAPDS